MCELKFHSLINYRTFRGIRYKTLDISYQIFGKKLHTAPVVLVNHALTGNSDLNSSEKGWWKQIVGNSKLIDTEKYTVIAFNIPGNGYDKTIIENYKDFIAGDIARIFYLVLMELKVENLYAAIGGSIGGSIAWEMAALYPRYIKFLIPIASDWKASDWIIGHNVIQESILLNSKKPLQDARKMAMLFYRTPASFTEKFNRTKTKDNKLFNVESWLNHHGIKLESRFKLNSYLMMNHLLTTVDITEGEKSLEIILRSIESKVIQIAVNSDLFFVKEENLKTKAFLDRCNVNNEYHEIISVDGHDAFLIEHEQITQFLAPIFQ